MSRDIELTSQTKLRLTDLPLEDTLLPYLELPSLASFLKASKATRALTPEDDSFVWQQLIERRWGPFEPIPPASQREALQYLEIYIRNFLRVDQNARQMIEVMQDNKIIRLREEPWLEVVLCILKWATTDEKRRVAALCCNEWQDDVSSLLLRLGVRGDTPEAALRDLLPRFPFLPIDAGQGADRVIGAFCRVFVRQNPDACAALGVAVTPLPLTATESEDNATDSESDGEITATINKYYTESKAARDVIYTLTYSIIMLNTDLHNKAIYPKITQDEYIKSCYRCAPLKDVNEAIFMKIYESISSQPLQLYSDPQLHHHHPTNPVGRSTREEQLYADHELDYAAAEAAAQQAAIAAQNARPHPPIDWNVAYWNLVDATRYARAASKRWIKRQRGGLVLFFVVLGFATVMWSSHLHERANEGLGDN